MSGNSERIVKVRGGLFILLTEGMFKMMPDRSVMFFLSSKPFPLTSASLLTRYLRVHPAQLPYVGLASKIELVRATGVLQSASF